MKQNHMEMPKIAMTESFADMADINAVRMWEKEMK